MKQHIRELLTITVLIRLFEPTICFIPKVHFSKSANTIGEFVNLGVIPFQRCKDECLKRTRCNALIYLTSSYNLCKLGSKVIANSDVIITSGSVLVSGFEEYHNTSHVCGPRVCQQKETCVEMRPGVHKCQVTECGPPEKASYDQQLLGNMYKVGDQINVEDKLGYIITCSSSGTWTVDSAIPQRIIIEKHDCLSSDGIMFPVNVTDSDSITFPVNVTDKVLCDVHTDGGNWLIFQRRQDGSENFYRGWDDYVNGFGNLTGEFWLGLEELYTITSSGDQYDLRIDMENFAGEKRYAEYSNFRIRNASDMYRLQLGSYSGNAGNSLGGHNGRQFTTFDRDNDANAANCAQIYKGAWWYSSCHSSNLNGIYFHSGGPTSYAININWKAWTGYRASLKTCEMKIRKST